MLFSSPLWTKAQRIPMSFPYHYTDYSNPTTPGGYPWDVEQDSNQVSVQPQEQPTTISPAQLQHHSPQSEPQPQHHQVQVVQQPQDVQTVSYHPPPTIEIQERVPPSQYRFDNIDESHFLQQEQSGRSETRVSSKRPPLRVSVDEMRPSTSSSVPTVGPSRVSHGRSTREQAHPYRRPISAGVGSSSGQQAVRSTRRERATSSDTRERTSQLHTGPVGVRSSAPALPVVGTSMAATCPAMYTWRVNLPQRLPQEHQQHQGQRKVSGGSVATTSPGALTPQVTPNPGSINTPLAPIAQLPQSALFSAIQQYQEPVQQSSAQPPPKRFAIRTDLHYDAETNLMTAMFELPGMKKSDLKLTMSVCPYSRVRQLTISGQSHPILPNTSGYTVQERKFGIFARTVVVPLETRPGDVDVQMEDGILILRIPGGVPAAREEPYDIAIP
ncbi:small heat shock protein (HSP20) family protein [Abortiporus biennis]